MQALSPQGEFRFIEQYFRILTILVFVHGPLMILGSASPIRFVFILGFLLSYLCLDLTLIICNLSRIKLNIIEVSLICILLFSVIVGLLNLTPISRRYVTDFLMPLSFVLKISLSRKFFSIEKYASFFSSKFLKRFAIAAFFSSIITIALFYIVVQFIPMYLGLTPIIYPFLIWAMMSKKNLYVLMAIAVIVFSGKRSILLGVVFVFMFYFIGIRKNKLKSIAALGGIILLGFIIFESAGIQDSRAFRKYEWTFYKLQEAAENPEVLDLVSGGRMGEIESIYQEMNSYDYLFGKGVGFTYELKSTGYGDVKVHSNAHFTPLALISKYGVVFYILIMFYILFSLFRARNKYRKNEWLSTFFFLYIIGVNIDFIFAYGFFTERLFPFAIGYLNRKRISFPIPEYKISTA